MATAPLDAPGPSDAELIDSVRGGNTAAYGSLYERHVGAAYNLARQQYATRSVFQAALRYRSRVDRMYWWQWRGASTPRAVRWDSGLLDAAGRPRPAYRIALHQRFLRR